MKTITLVQQGQNAASWQGVVNNTTANDIMNDVEGGKGLALPTQEGSWIVFGSVLVANSVLHVQAIPDEVTK